VLSWRGRWYVVGHDRGRGDMRSFRLDRIVGEVRTLAVTAQTSRPEDLDMLELVRGANHQPDQLASVRVVPGRGGQLRRLARQVHSTAEGEVLTLDYRDLDRLAGLVAGAGAEAVALEPPELVTAVIRLLSGVTGGPPGAPGNLASSAGAGESGDEVAGQDVPGAALTGGGR
jgi:proteasome accessory factor B